MITGITKTLATIDQMITGLASFGASDYIRSHKSEMQPLLTLDGTKYFQPTPELFLDGLNVLFSEEGSNKKACEIDVYKNFCDYVQDLGTTKGTTANSKVIVIIIQTNMRSKKYASLSSGGSKKSAPVSDINCKANIIFKPGGLSQVIFTQVMKNKKE